MESECPFIRGGGGGGSYPLWRTLLELCRHVATVVGLDRLVAIGHRVRGDTPATEALKLVMRCDEKDGSVRSDP